MVWTDPRVRELAKELLANDDTTPGDRRRDNRQEYLTLVTVHDAQVRDQILQAMSINLSESGMAIVHHDELVPGEYLLCLHRGQEKIATFRARQAWAHTLAVGWYISGWAFLSIDRV